MINIQIVSIGGSGPKPKFTNLCSKAIARSKNLAMAVRMSPPPELSVPVTVPSIRFPVISKSPCFAGRRVSARAPSYSACISINNNNSIIRIRKRYHKRGAGGPTPIPIAYPSAPHSCLWSLVLPVQYEINQCAVSHEGEGPWCRTVQVRTVGNSPEL
jgi:hypothetical protein